MVVGGSGADIAPAHFVHSDRAESAQEGTNKQNGGSNSAGEVTRQGGRVNLGGIDDEIAGSCVEIDFGPQLAQNFERYEHIFHGWYAVQNRFPLCGQE